MAPNPWEEDFQNKKNNNASIVDKLLDYLFSKFKNRGGRGTGRSNFSPVAIGFGILVLVGIWLASGFYMVQPDQKGLVMRFGRWVDTTGPGLQYHFPWPIETAIKPQVTKIRRINVGFASGFDYYNNNETTSDVPQEALMLTGDENIVDVHLSVFWLIRDPGKFLFQFDHPELTIKAVTESVMREIIAQNKIQNILTEGRKRIEIIAHEKIQQVLDGYNVGVMITEVKLQRVDPPKEVIASFRDVQAAAADQARMRNEAEGKANDIVPRARGQAKEIVLVAEAFKERKIKEAEGQKERFLALLAQYQDAPTLTKKRMYFEAMEEILSPLQKIIVDTTGTTVIPYLQTGAAVQTVVDSDNQKMIPLNSLLEMLGQQAAEK